MMNCGNSYWIKGAWNSRPHAFPIRSIGNCENSSFCDYCGESALALLEGKEQHLLRTEWAGYWWQPHSGSREHTVGHCRLGQAPAGCPRGAILLIIIRLILTAPVLPSDCHFFCKHFHFLLGSRYPIELSKGYTEPPLYLGDGIVDRPVQGTKLLLSEGTRPSYYVFAFHSTNLFCC